MTSVETPIEQIEPIVRIYDDKETNELVVDWNEKVTAEYIPEALREEHDRYVNAANQALRRYYFRSGRYAAVCGGFGVLGAIVYESPYGLLVGAPFMAVASTDSLFVARKNKRNPNWQTKGFVKDYDDFDPSPDRQIRLSLDHARTNTTFTRNEVGSDMFGELRDVLTATFDEFSEHLHYVHLSKQHSRAALTQIEARRRQVILDVQSTLPEHLNLRGDSYESLLRNPSFWEYISAKRASLLAALDSLSALEKMNQDIDTDEAIISFNAAWYISSIRDQPEQIELALPELVVLAHLQTQEPEHAIPQRRAQAVIDFAKKILNQKQRTELFSS